MPTSIIRVKRTLNSLDIEKDIKAFLSNPSGYLTVDFADLYHINPGGLDPIIEGAYKLQSTKGNLQIVNVAEKKYITLMNTKIGKKRAISLAEIYTNRDEDQINSFICSLIADYSKFGMGQGELDGIIRKSKKRYNKLHGPCEDERISAEELQRRNIEYGLIRCIRVIEERNKGRDIIDHLGYRYGETELILTQELIGKTKSTDQTTLIDGRRYRGEYNSWFNREGYGFITPDWIDKNVLVGQRDITGEKKYLTKGKRYEFTAKYNPAKRRWKGINVTPLTNL